MPHTDLEGFLNSFENDFGSQICGISCQLKINRNAYTLFNLDPTVDSKLHKEDWKSISDYIHSLNFKLDRGPKWLRTINQLMAQIDDLSPV